MAIGFDAVAPTPTNINFFGNLAAASDGSIWFTAYPSDSNGPALYRLPPGGTQVQAPPNEPALSGPLAVVAGPDGAIWVGSDGAIDHIGLTEFTPNWNRVFNIAARPQGIGFGADGDVWMTVAGAYDSAAGRQLPGSIIRLDPRTSVQTSFPISASNPGSIVAGPDGNLWFAELGGKVGKITTDGKVTEYDIGASSQEVVAGPDGALWFGTWSDNQTQIDRVTTDGKVTSYPLGQGSFPSGLVARADGSIWFADFNHSRLGSIDAAGHLTFLPIPYDQNAGGTLASDGKGGLLYEDYRLGKIERVVFGLPDPGVVAQPVALHHAEGALPAGLDVARFTSTDPNATESDFAANVAYGDDARNPGQVVADGKGGFLVKTGGGNVLTAGRNVITVTIFDTKHHNAVGAMSVAQGVSIIDDLPIAAKGADFAIAPNAAFSGIVATFTDPFPIDASNYSKTQINWGDGTTTAADSIAKVSDYTAPVGTFIVNGSHRYAKAGTYAVTVTVADVGATAVATSKATISANPSLLLTPTDFSFSQGERWKVLVATFSDPNPTSTSYQARVSCTLPNNNGAVDLLTEVVGNQIWATGTFNNPGAVPFQIYVARWGDPLLRVDKTAVVTAAPIMATGSALAPTVGVGFSLPIATFTSAPPYIPVGSFYASIDWGDGTTGVGQVQADNHGGYTVIGDHAFHQAGKSKVTVTIDEIAVDGTRSVAATATTNALIAAHDLVITTVPDIGFAQNLPSRVLVASFTDAPDLATTSYHAQITPTNLKTELAPNKTGGYDIFAVGLLPDWGTVPIQIEVNRIGGTPVVASTSAVVTPFPITAKAAPIAPGADGAFSGTLATFTVSSPFVSTFNYAAAVDWGDGTTSDAKIQVDPKGGFDVTGDHVFASGGTGKVTITINNVHFNGDHIVAARLVTSVAGHDIPLVAVPTIGFAEGIKSRVKVASFTDDPAFASAGYQARVTCTLPSSPKPVDLLTELVKDSSGGYDVYATAQFSDWGTIPIQVFVNRVGGAAVEADTSALVTPYAITATAAPIAATAGSVFSGRVASFTSPDVSTAPYHFAATIDWGDGTRDAGSIRYDSTGDGFDVIGNHIYAQAGSPKVTITIANLGADGSQSVASRLTSTTTVAAATIIVTPNLGARPTANTLFTGTVASFTDSNPGSTAASFDVTIHWGDGTSDTPGTVVASGPGQFLVQGAHLYAFSGPYTIRATVEPTDGRPTTGAETVVTVLDAPFDTQGTDLKGTAGSVASGVVTSFYDPTPSPMDQYAAAIDWGDGTTSQGVVSSYNNQFVVYGSHTYAQAGTYSSKVTITEGAADPVVTPITVTIQAQSVVGTPAGDGPVGQTNPPPSGPTLVSARTTKDRRGAIHLVLTFSGAMDGSATDAARYVVTDPGKDGKFGTKDDRTVKIRSAVYDSRAHTVTLSPRGAFSRKSPYRVAVKGGPSATLKAMARK